MGKGNVFNRLIGNVNGGGVEGCYSIKDLSFVSSKTLLQGEDTIGNANTELLVLTGWAAWRFAASRHDVLDW